MATSKSHRVFMWAMVVVMVVGTMGAFFLPILMNDNALKEQEEQQKIMKQLQEQQQASQAATAKPLDGYSAEPFDAASVAELKTEDLVEGEGDSAVTTDSTIKANYFGWTADGKIFDSTNKDGTTTPVEFPLSGVIEGWTKGLVGAKVGTVRKLTIPTAMAYGDKAAEQGRPAGPLVFIVQVTEIK